MLALKHGSAKDRKTIIKSFKTYIGKVGTTKAYLRLANFTFFLDLPRGAWVEGSFDGI